MRWTLLFVSAGLLLALALAPPAMADTQTIPATCRTVSVQNGWGTGNDKEINWFWYDEATGRLYHRGTGYYEAIGDTYCRGKWYIDGNWWVADPAFPEGVEGHLWGSVRIELSHANFNGGFTFDYEGDFIWDAPNRVWAGTILNGVGYGDLVGWQISGDVYLPYYPPVGCWGPGCPQRIVWQGFLTPPGN